MPSKILSVGFEEDSSSEATMTETTVRAIESCLEKGGKNSKEIDLLIHMGAKSDHVLGDVTQIQDKVKATNAASFQLKDIDKVGLLSTFVQAHSYIESKQHCNIVVTYGGEINRSNESVSLAASALFLTKSERGGLVFHRYGKHSLSKEFSPLENLPFTPNWIITFCQPKPLPQKWIADKEHHLNDFYEISFKSPMQITYTLMKALEKKHFTRGDKLFIWAEGSKKHTASIVWEW